MRGMSGCHRSWCPPNPLKSLWNDIWESHVYWRTPRSSRPPRLPVVDGAIVPGGLVGIGVEEIAVCPVLDGAAVRLELKARGGLAVGR